MSSASRPFYSYEKLLLRILNGKGVVLVAYRVSYDGAVVTKTSVSVRKKRRWVPVTVLLLLFGAMVFPGGRLILRNILLPGDEVVTANALEALVENLKSGDSVSDVLEAFCLEIIHGG